jgi:hypothetical protein
MKQTTLKDKITIEIREALREAKTCPNKYYVGKVYGLKKALALIEGDKKTA